MRAVAGSTYGTLPRDPTWISPIERRTTTKLAVRAGAPNGTTTWTTPGTKAVGRTPYQSQASAPSTADPGPAQSTAAIRRWRRVGSPETVRMTPGRIRCQAPARTRLRTVARGAGGAHN